MKKLIYSQEDLDLILSLETQEKDEENKKLKEKVETEHKAFMGTVQELTETATRIDKAIEYIEDKQKIQFKYALSHIECDDLLDILKGSDNNVK